MTDRKEHFEQIAIQLADSRRQTLDDWSNGKGKAPKGWNERPRANVTLTKAEAEAFQYLVDLAFVAKAGTRPHGVTLSAWSGTVNRLREKALKAVAFHNPLEDK